MITNQSKPTTSLTNISRALNADTWNSIITTWANETRTWVVVSKIYNVYVDFGFLWSANHYPWQDTTPWLYSNFTNQSKP